MVYQILKSDSQPPNFFVTFNESLLKMMENAFYFTLKALFVLEIFKFLSRLFVYVKKTGLIRIIRLVSKFMTSQLV